jgi:transposase
MRVAIVSDIHGKPGNTMVLWLLIEAVHPAVRNDAELRQDHQRLKFRSGHAVAKVAIARKLAVRMYWMLRSGAAYAQLVRTQGSPEATLVDASSSSG